MLLLRTLLSAMSVLKFQGSLVRQPFFPLVSLQSFFPQNVSVSLVTSLTDSRRLPPSLALSLVRPLILYDTLSWVLLFEPSAPLVRLSFVLFHSLYLSVSLEDHSHPTYFLLQLLQPPLPPTSPSFSVSSPFVHFSHSVCPFSVLWLHLFVLVCPDILLTLRGKRSGHGHL